jgi:hypothetical protein
MGSLPTRKRRKHTHKEKEEACQQGRGERLNKKRRGLQRGRSRGPGLAGICSFLEVILYEEWTRDYSGRLVFLP